MKTKDSIKPNLTEPKDMKEIRKELMQKNNPTMFQKMRQATQRMKDGEPTLDDYRLIMQWPAMASMFMRNSLKK
jgi:hypothetical protein